MDKYRFQCVAVAVAISVAVAAASIASELASHIKRSHDFLVAAE